MTEAEWLASDDVRALAATLSAQDSVRKRRLFACACARRVWRNFPNDDGRRAVEVAERYADGQARKADLKQAQEGMTRASATLFRDDPHNIPVRFAVSAAYCATKAGVSSEMVFTVALEANQSAGNRDGVVQARLFRCVFGNPFRPASAGPSWLTSTVEPLAQAAYAERDLPSGELVPERLAVLADALEEAGCDNADLLGHLRGPGPHVRGCWALDLLLGKQ
jgi:hypothetical protein